MTSALHSQGNSQGSSQTGNQTSNFDSKVLPIACSQPFSRDEQQAIELFNARIDKKQLQLRQHGEKLLLLLKEVDLYQLKRTVAEISASSDILERVLETIEAVKSYGIKGKKRVFVNYNKERKVQGRAAKVEKRGQYFYARGENFAKTSQPLQPRYIDKILCGDSEKILQAMPDNCIDLVFTSPPYNFGLDYQQGEDDKGDDNKVWQAYFTKLFAVFDQCIRVLKYGGRIVVNLQPLFSDYIPCHHIVSQHFIKRQLIWKGEILWEKNNYNCKYTAWGSWKSPSNPYLKYTWEFLEIFCKGSLKKEGSRDNIDITADEFKKWVVGKWSIAPERAMKDFDHPAMFPEQLAHRVLKLFSYQGDTILDPFNGVGTTTLVAKKLQRRYLGIDISDDYCKKANKRLQGV